MRLGFVSAYLKRQWLHLWACFDPLLSRCRQRIRTASCRSSWSCGEATADAAEGGDAAEVEVEQAPRVAALHGAALGPPWGVGWGRRGHAEGLFLVLSHPTLPVLQSTQEPRTRGSWLPL